MADNDGATRLIIPAVGPLYEALTPLTIPLIRVVTGLFLMPHGAQKLFGLFGGGGLHGSAAFFAKLGLEPSMFFAVLVGGTEFFGGLCLALGFLTRIASAGVVILMAVAVFTVHLPNGYFWTSGGFEYPLFWGLIALAFFVRGGGACSVDRLLGREF